jgi:RNA polymerase sigma-70 factor (ECF subfamily)
MDVGELRHQRANGVKQNRGRRLSKDVVPSRDSCTPVGESFEAFVESVSPRLSRAFVARYGVELGAEAFADALGWAWEHRDELASMENATGYLYRVGQTSVRTNLRRRRRAVLPVEESVHAMPEASPGLHVALAYLTDDQRAAVVLVHAHGYSYAEAAALLDISVSTLRNHVHRGMNRLRKRLEH